MCDKGKVENVKHFYFTIRAWWRREGGDGEIDERTVEEWQEMEGKEKVVWVVD